MAGSELLRECFAFAGAFVRFAGRRSIAAMLLVGAGAVLEGVGILLLVPLLTTLFDQGAAGGSTLAQWVGRIAPGLPPFDRLALILAAFGVLMLVRGFILWRRDILIGRLQIGFVEEQRALIARRLAAARWEMLARIGHGRVTHLMGGDIQRCGAGAHFLLQSGVAVVMLVAQTALAFALSPLLTLIAVGLMAIATAALSGVLRRSRDVGTVVTRANLSLMTGLGRFLGGMKMAMSQNLQGAFVTAFQHELHQGVQQQTAFLGQQAMLRGMWSLMAACVGGMTVLIGYGALHLTAPVLLALLVLLSRISGPASQIHLGLQQIAYSLPAWKAVTAMERELADAEAPPLAAGAPPLAGAVSFEQVVYRHEGGAGGLAGLSVRIQPGEMIGICGESGAGKTSFADLLAGLLRPHGGRIAIGGVVLDDAVLGQWRGQLAYVAQDPVLFNDSVRGNLHWANPAADEGAMRAALALAGAQTLVDALPRGLETIVGEAGSLISGGERQRLALARALLRAPTILILDEATNAIDVAGEYAILSRLRALDPRPTIVLIAHRAESLALCDRILTFAAGRLVKDENRQIAPPGPRRRTVPA